MCDVSIVAYSGVLLKSERCSAKGSELSWTVSQQLLGGKGHGKYKGLVSTVKLPLLITHLQQGWLASFQSAAVVVSFSVCFQ